MNIYDSLDLIPPFSCFFFLSTCLLVTWVHLSGRQGSMHPLHGRALVLSGIPWWSHDGKSQSCGIRLKKKHLKKHETSINKLSIMVGLWF